MKPTKFNLLCLPLRFSTVNEEYSIFCLSLCVQTCCFPRFSFRRKSMCEHKERSKIVDILTFTSHDHAPIHNSHVWKSINFFCSSSPFVCAFRSRPRVYIVTKTCAIFAVERTLFSCSQAYFFTTFFCSKYIKTWDEESRVNMHASNSLSRDVSKQFPSDFEYLLLVKLQNYLNQYQNAIGDRVVLWWKSSSGKTRLGRSTLYFTHSMVITWTQSTYLQNFYLR